MICNTIEKLHKKSRSRYVDRTLLRILFSVSLVLNNLTLTKLTVYHTKTNLARSSSPFWRLLK